MGNRLRMLMLTALPFLVFSASASLTTPVGPDAASDFALINPDHIDGAYTGGFNEPTCHSCHFDYDLNPPGGSLNLSGIPVNYIPEKEYKIKIMLQSEQLENGGFQLTARFEDGTQAGTFSWDGDRLQFTRGINSEVDYLQQTLAGTRPTDDRKIEWEFIWKAPSDDLGNVYFHTAANAGNDDDSAFGDWIYTDKTKSEPND